MRQVARLPDLDARNRETGRDRLRKRLGELVRWAAESVEERDERLGEAPHRRATEPVGGIVIDRLDHETVDDLQGGAVRWVGGRVAASAHRSVRARARKRLDETLHVASGEHGVGGEDEERRIDEAEPAADGV